MNIQHRPEAERAWAGLFLILGLAASGMFAYHVFQLYGQYITKYLPKLGWWWAVVFCAVYYLQAGWRTVRYLQVTEVIEHLVTQGWLPLEILLDTWGKANQKDREITLNTLNNWRSETLEEVASFLLEQMLVAEDWRDFQFLNDFKTQVNLIICQRR